MSRRRNTFIIQYAC